MVDGDHDDFANEHDEHKSSSRLTVYSVKALVFSKTYQQVTKIFLLDWRIIPFIQTCLSDVTNNLF
jgi:hypothetical protein